MNAHPQFLSPTFDLVAKGLLALHRLGQAGGDDSPEAEAVRDSLDLPLRALSRLEYERSRWLSEDLYSVSEPLVGTYSRATVPDPSIQQKLLDSTEARQNGEWDRALELLRDVRDQIAPALLGCLRGAIWLQAGNFEIAGVFFKHAIGMDLIEAIAVIGEKRSHTR